MPDKIMHPRGSHGGNGTPPVNPSDANGGNWQSNPTSSHQGLPAPPKQADQMRVVVAGESRLGKAGVVCDHRELGCSAADHSS